ncbi:hypothetical protein D3C80_1988700 [compost metagenome]
MAGGAAAGDAGVQLFLRDVAEAAEHSQCLCPADSGGKQPAGVGGECDDPGR